MIKNLTLKNKIGISILSNSISKNGCSFSSSKSNFKKNTSLDNNKSPIITTTTNCSITKSSNNNNIICQKRNFYTTVNSQFQNKKYDIMQSIPNSQNLKDIYRILNDISMSSYYKTANIRISFFNQDRDKCDIKGVKLYGSSNSCGLIVIVGGRDSTQCKNVALSLYLSTLFADKPLKNFDVVIFPVENPTPITLSNKATRSADLMMSNTLNHIQSIGGTSPSFLNSNITTFNNLNSCFNSFPNNSPNEFYPKTKGNHALHEWLKKSKKEFNYLNINKNDLIEPKPNNKKIQSNKGFFDSSINDYCGFENTSLVLDESNEEQNEISDLPNFIFEIKDFNIHPNFRAEELYALGSNLANQLTEVDKMYSPKKFSPISFS